MTCFIFLRSHYHLEIIFRFFIFRIIPFYHFPCWPHLIFRSTVISFAKNSSSLNVFVNSLFYFCFCYNVFLTFIIGFITNFSSIQKSPLPCFHLYISVIHLDVIIQAALQTHGRA